MLPYLLYMNSEAIRLVHPHCKDTKYKQKNRFVGRSFREILIVCMLLLNVYL